MNKSTNNGAPYYFGVRVADRSAAAQTLAKLRSAAMPEVEYFLENFIPAFELTLDELDFSAE